MKMKASDESNMRTKFRKIRFHLPSGEWHGRPSETLWAEPVEEVSPSTIFRLRNSPFFAEGVSFLDVVSARPEEPHGGDLEFVGVIERGGHSTYLILVPADSLGFTKYWGALQDLGCSYESKRFSAREGGEMLYSVDVPPDTDIYAAYEALEDGERNGVWTFQESHVGHKTSHDTNKDIKR